MSKISTSHRFLLIVIFLLALATRLGGIGYRLHPDESYQLYNVLRVGKLDFSETYLVGIYSYIMFAYYSLFFLGGLLLGKFSSLSDFIYAYCINTNMFYYAGRVAESLAGVAGCWVIYILGRKVFNPKVGLIAAFFLALNVTQVQISQSARGQAFCSLFIILSLYFIYKIVNSQRLSHYLWAGFFIGAGTSIRIFSLIMFVPLGIAFIKGFLSGKRNRGTGRVNLTLKLSLGVTLFLSTWLLCNISILSSLGCLSREITLILKTIVTKDTAGVAADAYVKNAWKEYLMVYLPQGFGWFLYPVSVAGIIYGLFLKRDVKFLILSLYPVIYIAVMGRSTVANARYLIPVIPPMILLAALILENGVSRFRAPPRQRATLMVCLCVFLVIPPTRGIVRNDIAHNKPITQTVARDWVFQNISAGTAIAVESSGYGGPYLKLFPMIDFDLYRLPESELKRIYRERASQDPNSSLVLKCFIENLPRLRYRIYNLPRRQPVDLDYLIDQKIEYAIITQDVYDAYQLDNVKGMYPSLYESRMKFYRWVKERGEKIRVFKRGGNVSGKEITIYKLNY